MSIKSFCAALSALAFVVVSASSAWATNNPIPGIDIIIKTNPGGIVVAQGTTDARGGIDVKELSAGQYTIELNPKPGSDAAKLHGAGWLVALMPVGPVKDPTPARPLTSAPKASAKGFQANIVIPDGPAKSYKFTLTR